MTDEWKIWLAIDSGAYSAFTKGEPIPLDDWIAFCLRVAPKVPDALLINLDVIGKSGEDTGEKSYNNWVEMRKAGLNPLPVFHVGTDEKWLKKYMELTDYIGLGAIADLITHRRMWALDRMWEKYFIDGERHPKIKVHAMGVTSFPLMQRYGWYSIDSTSWLQAGMYGKIFMPRLTGGEWDYTKSPYPMNISTQSPRVADKGLHYENLGPERQAVVDRYIKENGFVLGTRKILEEMTEEDTPGLRNNYYLRCFLNSLFYSRFVGAMKWSRPLAGQKPKGFFDTQEENKNTLTNNGEGRTRLYFSGEIPIESYMRKHPECYPNCGIMLTYYTLKGSDVARPARRLRGIEKNKPYKEGRKRKGLKVMQEEGVV